MTVTRPLTVVFSAFVLGPSVRRGFTGVIPLALVVLAPTLARPADKLCDYADAYKINILTPTEGQVVSEVGSFPIKIQVVPRENYCTTLPAFNDPKAANLHYLELWFAPSGYGQITLKRKFDKGAEWTGWTQAFTEKGLTPGQWEMGVRIVGGPSTDPDWSPTSTVHLQIEGKRVVPLIVAPKPGQPFGSGQSVLFQVGPPPAVKCIEPGGGLVKPLKDCPLAPVEALFRIAKTSPYAIGFKKTVETKLAQVSSLLVPASEFTMKGEWEVRARYVGTPDVSDPVSFHLGTQTLGPPGPMAPAPGLTGNLLPLPTPVPGGGPPPPPLASGPTPAPPGGLAPSPAPRLATVPPQPLRLVSAQQHGAEVLLVLANPAGNADLADLLVELRLRGRPVGRSRLGHLAAGRDKRLAVRYQLPAGTGGPVELEVWGGSLRLGALRVTPLARAQ